MDLESVEFIKESWGLKTKTPNIYRISAFIDDASKLNFWNYNDSPWVGNSFHAASSYRSVLEDDKIVTIAERLGISDKLAVAKSNLGHVDLYVRVVQGSDLVVADALNKILDGENPEYHMSLVAEKIKLFFPDEIFERIKQLNNFEINLALSKNPNIPNTWRQYLIDSQNPYYYAELFRHDGLAEAAYQIAENVIKNFDDDATVYVAPYILQYFERNEDEIEKVPVGIKEENGISLLLNLSDKLERASGFYIDKYTIDSIRDFADYYGSEEYEFDHDWR